MRRANSRRDLAACRGLVSAVYANRYGVRMTHGRSDPNGGLERFPDRFTLATLDGEVVACSGLYTTRTYVEEYGQITNDDLERVVGPGASRRARVEYTKVVVRPGYEGRGLGRWFIGVTHGRVFLEQGGELPLVLVCARLSVFALWEAVGIHTRTLKPFPTYRNHERYRSSTDPMESRVVVPEEDVDARWFEPASDAFELSGALHAL